MLRRWIAPVLGVGVVVAVTAAAPVEHQVHAPLQVAAFDLAADSTSVPIEMVEGHVQIPVTINGKGPFTFLFDTGARGSVMDMEFATQQGFELGAEVRVASPGGEGRPGRLASLERVSVGSLVIHDLRVVAFDGLPFPKTATSPRGVLGPYSLSGLLITLDYPAKRLVFRRGALPEADNREIFGWDQQQRLPEVPITLAGKELKAHLDTGSSGGIGVPPALADELPLGGPLLDGGYAMTVDRVLPARRAPLKGALTLGRFTLADPTLTFVDVGKGLVNIGVGVLGGLAITLDPANRRLRLVGPANGQIALNEVPKPRYGMQLTDLGDNAPEVRVVDAGSPAEKGGVRAGDRIVALNGTNIADLPLTDRARALKAPTLQLTLQRGESRVEVNLAAF